MTALHLIRLKIGPQRLARFAVEQNLLRQGDDGHGYVLHAWLAAMFGEHAPKPFRYFDHKGELMGYGACAATTLRDHAQVYSHPIAHDALEPDSLASKPMPVRWGAGQRLHIDVLACPASRKDDTEKDVYLRTLDRMGDRAPPRSQVYLDWFARQLGDAVAVEHAELGGFARRKLLRRVRADAGRRLQSIERPQAHFHADVVIRDGEAFGALLARGVGRHRAFGFGMVLLSPAR